MTASRPAIPSWARTLRALMEQKDLNPRRLSLEAGLNPTAVRDMLEGRTKFPRYDTVMALAAALGTTPARLMDGRSPKAANDEDFGEDLDLLTEIIARLQEIVAEHRRKLPPQDFAAITAAIYRRMRADRPGAARGAIGPRIHDLLGYEMLRQRKRR